MEKILSSALQSNFWMARFIALGTFFILAHPERYCWVFWVHGLSPCSPPMPNSPHNYPKIKDMQVLFLAQVKIPTGCWDIKFCTFITQLYVIYHIAKESCIYSWFLWCLLTANNGSRLTCISHCNKKCHIFFGLDAQYEVQDISMINKVCHLVNNIPHSSVFRYEHIIFRQQWNWKPYLTLLHLVRYSFQFHCWPQKICSYLLLKSVVYTKNLQQEVC